MTTPQNILYNLERSIEEILQIIRPMDEDYRANIYEMIKDVQIETTEFNERMELLEDKMNIIIKLLSKKETISE
jgi:hypothetical protein